MRDDLQSEAAEDAGLQRLQILHPLRNKSFPVAVVQETIVRQRTSCHRIDRGIADYDSEIVLSGFQKRA